MKTSLFISIILYAASFVAAVAFHGVKLASVEALSKWLLSAGLLFHTAGLVMRVAGTGHAPMADMHETLLFYSWATTLLSVGVIFRYRETATRLITVPIAVSALLFAFINEKPGRALTLILRTRWFETHVTFSFVAYAFFTLAFSAALLYLICSARNADEAELKKYQDVAGRSILWGFGFFSASMFSGAVWAYLAWGLYWMWEPKIIWSFIVWFYYAGAMHACFVREWKGKGLAWATVIGFFVALFTYLGVGMLMKSSHNF